MELSHQGWQQDLGGVAARIVPSLLSLCALFCSVSGTAFANQSFAVALPELEGPVTMGLFSERGALVRLLYKDAKVDSIPAGLNGLIMTWDDKDDSGERVPPGKYRARGLVHGPLSVDQLPYQEVETPPWILTEPDQQSIVPAGIHPEAFICIRAAKDELLERRPMLPFSATLEGSKCILYAAGLPLLDLPLEANDHISRITLAKGPEPGVALMTLIGPGVKKTYHIRGLDCVVPLNAGSLEIAASGTSPEGFHPTRASGESNP
jgi:hypothetical protein